MTILAVCGLQREAEIAGSLSSGRGSANRSSGVIAVAGGGDGDGLKARLEALHGDIAGVISIGLGGALSPLLKVGEVVIAEKIITGLESWECHAGWRNRLDDVNNRHGAIKRPLRINLARTGHAE